MSGKNGAAEILGLDRNTLRGRMRKLGINRAQAAELTTVGLSALIL